MRVILHSGKAIRGFLGHYPEYFPGTVGAITFDIQHCFAKGKWFTEFAVQSNGDWHHKTIYQSDNQQTATIYDDKGDALQIKIYKIDQHGADFDLVAEFDNVTYKGVIFKRKHVERIRDDEIKLLKEYINNAIIQG